jgi:hypothetical protein
MGHVLDQNTTRADGTRISDAVEDRLRLVFNVEEAGWEPPTDFDTWRDDFFADNAYLSPREAIADAYLEVRTLGDDASPASKALVDMMEDDLTKVGVTPSAPARKAAQPVLADVEPLKAPPTAPLSDAVRQRNADPGYEKVLERIPEGTEIQPIYQVNKDGSVKTKPVYEEVRKGRKLVKTDKVLYQKPVLDVQATLDAIPDEVLKNNWRIAIEAARNSEGGWAYEAGKVWYPELGEVADYWSKKYAEPFRKQFGRNPTRDDVAVIFAMYSENNSWAGNLLGVRQFMEGTSTSFHRKKARAAVTYKDGALAWLEENASPKIYNFGSNIAGRYSQATVDRWVSRIILHTDDYEFADNIWAATKTVNKVESRPGYERFDRILRELTAEYPDLNTAAVQAIPWVHVVGPRGAVTYDPVVETVKPGLGSHTAINKALRAETERRFGKPGDWKWSPETGYGDKPRRNNRPAFPPDADKKRKP